MVLLLLFSQAEQNTGEEAGGRLGQWRGRGSGAVLPHSQEIGRCFPLQEAEQNGKTAESECSVTRCTEDQGAGGLIDSLQEIESVLGEVESSCPELSKVVDITMAQTVYVYGKCKLLFCKYLYMYGQVNCRC